MGEQNRRTTEGGPDAAADLEHARTNGLSDAAHVRGRGAPSTQTGELEPPEPEDAPQALIHDAEQTRRQAPDDASEDT